MENVATVLTFILNICSTIFAFFMSNWVLSLFFVACILVFVLDLVVSSSSGDDVKR